MKKYIKYILITLIMFMVFSDVVYAADANLKLCEDAGIIKTFQIGGYALYIIKIFVPILLIIFTMIDLFKAVISGDDGALKKQIGSITKRAIAAVVIFLLPALVDAAFSVIDNYSDIMEEYKACYNCLIDPNDPDRCSAKEGD